MSSLRIINVAPIIRAHYGTLWHDSQHPIGYLAVLIGAPLIISLIGLLVQVDATISQWSTGLFGAILALSARTAFGLPSIGDNDGERESRAVTQLRRGAMYSVLVGIVSFVVSLTITVGFYLAIHEPQLVTTISEVTSPGIVAWLPKISTVILLFFLIHYIITMLVLVRWIHLMSEAGTL